MRMLTRKSFIKNTIIGLMTLVVAPVKLLWFNKPKLTPIDIKTSGVIFSEGVEFTENTTKGWRWLYSGPPEHQPKDQIGEYDNGVDARETRED